MTAAEAAAARTVTRDVWIRKPEHVRRRAGRAIWDAAEAGAGGEVAGVAGPGRVAGPARAAGAAGAAGAEPDPLVAIDAARRFAADLVDRLARTAADGEHLATCLAHGRGGEPGLAADLALSRRGRRCITDREGAGTTFGGLLVLGALTGAPVALILRSCRDPCHATAGHESTVRGWVVRDRHAHPMSRGAVRTIAHGGRRPHPALPQHPEEGTEYEKAYSLYA